MESGLVVDVDPDTLLIRNLANSISNLTGASERGLPANNNSSFVVSVVSPNVSMVHTPKVDPKIIAQAVRNVTKMAADTSTSPMDVKFKTESKQKAPEKPRAPTRVMVLDAIRTLDEPYGSALRKIKKFIYAKYEVNNEKRANYYIRAYLKKAFLRGELIQKKRTKFSVNRKFKIAPTKLSK